MADVTVTIVLYNSSDHLEPCLTSLRPELESGHAVLVAVDNASPDDSAAVVQRLAPGSVVIESDRNLGFAGGCNLAWPHVQTPYWLLLNPDTILEPDTLRRLVEVMEADPKLGAASPWLRDPAEAAWEYPGRAWPSAWRALLEITRLHRLLPPRVRARVLQGPYVAHDREPPPTPDWLPGTALIVRADAVHRAGPLDASFFLYGEDLEWCWRLRRDGWRLGVADAVVLHHARASGERTWSEQAVDTRMAAGMIDAMRKTRGRLRARAVALTWVVALALESLHPRRKPEQRADAARARRAWWQALRRA